MFGYQVDVNYPRDTGSVWLCRSSSSLVAGEEDTFTDPDDDVTRDNAKTVSATGVYVFASILATVWLAGC